MSSAPEAQVQLASALRRLSTLLDEETAALQENRLVDHNAFAVRKDMIAFELGAMARMASAVAPDEELRRAFQNLSGKLEQNRQLLQTHIGATRHIAKMLSDVVRAVESDGTYSVPPARRARP